MSPASAIRIHPGDNVAIALSALAAGDTVMVDGQSLTVLREVPAGHMLVIEKRGKLNMSAFVPRI